MSRVLVESVWSMMSSMISENTQFTSTLNYTADICTYIHAYLHTYIRTVLSAQMTALYSFQNSQIYDRGTEKVIFVLDVKAYKVLDVVTSGGSQ